MSWRPLQKHHKGMYEKKKRNKIVSLEIRYVSCSQESGERPGKRRRTQEHQPPLVFLWATFSVIMLIVARTIPDTREFYFDFACCFMGSVVRAFFSGAKLNEFDKRPFRTNFSSIDVFAIITGLRITAFA